MLAYDVGPTAIDWFGEALAPAWTQNGTVNTSAMLTEAATTWPAVRLACDAFDRTQHATAVNAGGEQYAQLLALAYRQAMGALQFTAPPSRFRRNGSSGSGQKPWVFLKQFLAQCNSFTSIAIISNPVPCSGVFVGARVPP